MEVDSINSEYEGLESGPSCSYKVDEVDTLSTNNNKQMDRQIDEVEDEDTASNMSNEEVSEKNAEIDTARKILSDLMSDAKKAVNWPFMESIQESAPDLYEDYMKQIERPVWLKLMKSKFDSGEYKSITEFVSDFRLMLENCYRFNGPDHYISKRGQKLETMLEQKLVLLSRELREKTSIEATSGIKNKGNNSPGFVGMRRRQKTLVPHDSTNLLNQLREQEQQKVREWRKQQILDRKAEKEALALEILTWEDTVLFGGKYKEQMKVMWELPQIGLFLFLCQGPLNVGEVMHFELERCFLIPRESSTLQLIMTSLLSTPFQRLKIDRKSLMPYKVWEQKLKVKVQQWYKVYTDTGCDAENTWQKLGIDGRFFEIVGHKNPLEKRKFHELSFYKKVWIVKSLCDNCLQNQDSLRETIELQPFADQREYVLGTDSEGRRYIHFPQFCGADVRVYRQAPVKYPKLEIKPDHFDNKRKFPLVYKPPPPKKLRLQKKKKKLKNLERPSPQPSPNRQRPSRLRQSVKQVVPLQLGDSAENSDSDSSDDSEPTSGGEDMDVDETGDADSVDADSADNSVLYDEEEGSSGRKQGQDNHDLIDNLADTGDASANKSKDDVDRLSSGSDVTIPYCDISDTNSTYSSRDCSRESSPFRSADLRIRRSARLEKLSDGSREASPLIYDSDFRYSRSSRSKTRLKSSKFKASRNLSNFLLDENSTTSNSSAFGEPVAGISGILTDRLLGNANLNLNSNSSETGEESLDCDIQKLFGNTSKSDCRESERSQDSPTVNNHEGGTCASRGLSEETRTQLGDETDSTSNNIIDKGDSIHDTNIAESGDNHRDYHREELSATNLDAKHIPNGNLSTDTDEKGDNLLVDSKTKPRSEHSIDNKTISTKTDLTSNCIPDQDRSVSDLNNSHTSEIVHENSDTDMADNNIQETLDSQPCNDDTNTDTGLDQSTNSVSQCDTILTDICNIGSLTGEQDAVTAENTSEGATEYTEMTTTEECMKIPNTEEQSIKQEICNDINENEDIKGCEANKIAIVKEENLSENQFKDEEFMKLPVVDSTTLKSEHHLSIFNTDDKSVLDSDSKEVFTSTIKSGIVDNDYKPIADNNDKDSNAIQIKSDPDIKQECLDNIEDTSNESKEMVEESTDIQKSEALDKDIQKDEALNKESIKQEEMVESEEEEEEEEKVPDMTEFELLADSVEDLRTLTAQFEEQEPIVIRKGKKEQITRPPPRKKCVVHLHERLQFLLKELEPWESRLVQATKRARIRIRKEVEDYVEPPETEDTRWDTTDEETESGASDDEVDKVNKDGDNSKDGLDDVTKYRATLMGKLSRDSLSGASTPIKLDDQDEIDISQRGRLRKRRIIPNNAEDQIAPKKPKFKPESSIQDTPTSSTPIIIQSGKSQIVEYSDILRQLQSANSKGSLPKGLNPVLIKTTTQGGRTVLTSVLPVNIAQSNSAQKLQNVRLPYPVSVQHHVSGQNFSVAVTSPMSMPTKISQHPTIQYLLTGSNSVTPISGVKENSASTSLTSMVRILPQSALQGGVVTTLSSQQRQTLLTPVKGQGQPGTIMITPEKLAVTTQSSVQPTQQKLVFNPVVTPRKIAPHPVTSTSANKQPSTSKQSVKYYAANASTLPINVVQQLLATRGAKLQTRPNQQSILYIPMENDADTINVGPVPGPVPGQYVSGLPKSTSNSVSLEGKMTTAVINTPTTVSVSVTTPGTPTSSSKKSPVTSNMLILPKPLTLTSSSPPVPPGYMTVPVQHTANPSPTLAGNAVISKTVKTLFQSRLATGGIALNPTSPPRYPTNETVRTLLDKRKSVDDKSVSIVKTVSDNKQTVYACIASQLQRPCPSSMSSSVMLKQMAASADPNTYSMIHPASLAMTGINTLTQDSVLSENVVKVTSVQQHVLTSISPAKLNTLLLQTSAAGAKSIPSLIKLPSKAVLDSAVKAVVTSVNTTLPTVNIKVPSPTSLPSIGPRRNVTKTIQTMKSPIPVAPKVVTQNSGQTSLSVADSHCLFTTQSTIVNSSQSNNTSQLAVQSNTTPLHAHVVASSLDGKKLITKLPTVQGTPTSEAVPQVGYLTPQGYVIPVTRLQQSVGNQSASAILNQIGLQAQTQGSQSTAPGMQLVMPNTDGLLQLVPKLNLQAQTSTTKVTLPHNGSQATSPILTNQQAKKGNASKQMVAINAQGKHIIVKQKSDTPTGQSSDPHVIQTNTGLLTQIAGKVQPSQPLHVATNLKPAVVSPNIELKLPTGNYLLPQTGSGLLSPVGSQPSLSPLLNMQQVLVPGAGIQLASPVVNPVGLNLVHTNLPIQNQAVSQNSKPVQVTPSSTVPQVMNINPALLSQALATNLGQHQRKLAPAVSNRLQTPAFFLKPATAPPVNYVQNSDSTEQKISSHVTSKPEINVTKSGSQHLPVTHQRRGSVDGIGAGSPSISSPPLVSSPNSITPTGKPKHVVFQFAASPQKLDKETPSSELTTRIPESLMIANTVPSNVTPKQIFLNSHVNASTAATDSQALDNNTDTNTSISAAGSVTKPIHQPQLGKPGQLNQKLLLYSIAGQLVTGQGVPVTVHQGVLKVMPQGKLQIANQTLTPEQIKQTLAKIGNTILSTESNTPQVAQPAGINVTTTLSNSVNSDIKPILGVPNVLNMTCSTTSHVENIVNTIKTEKTSSTLSGSVAVSSTDHDYLNKQKTSQTYSRVKQVAHSSDESEIKHVIGSSDLSKSDIVMKGAKSNSVYIMKPMTCSAGYTVFPSQFKGSESHQADIKPAVNVTESKHVQGHAQNVGQSAVSSKFVTNVNGQNDKVVDLLMKSVKGLTPAAVKVKCENVDDDDDDDDGNHLVIDDSANEKEAALNLLTLANQALGPTNKSAKK